MSAQDKRLVDAITEGVQEGVELVRGEIRELVAAHVPQSISGLVMPALEFALNRVEATVERAIGQTVVGILDKLGVTTGRVKMTAAPNAHVTFEVLP